MGAAQGRAPATVRPASDRTATTLVFDFGAVVFRWQPTQLLRELLPGHATDEASARAWAGRIFQGYGGDWLAFDRGALDTDALVPRIAARTGLAPAQVRAVVEAVGPHLAPLPDTVALVERLHAAGQPLYYLSNMPAPYAEHLERTHALVGRFAGGVFSSRVGLCKPEPAIFALAAERFGRPPEALVLLDDSPPNVAAARAAGWRALQFHDAAQAEAELREQGWWPDGAR